MEELTKRVQEQLDNNWPVDKEDIQALLDKVTKADDKKWISVKDRWPKTFCPNPNEDPKWRQSDEVLSFVTREFTGNIETRIVRATYIECINAKSWVYNTFDDDNFNGEANINEITHWMPIPKPPKETDQ